MADYFQQSKRELLHGPPPKRARSNRRMRGSDRRKLQIESQQVASEISRLERFIRAPKSQGRKRYSRLEAAVPVADRPGGLFGGGTPMSGPIRLEVHRQRRTRMMHLAKFLFWLFVLMAFCGWLVYWSAMV